MALPRFHGFRCSVLAGTAQDPGKKFPTSNRFARFDAGCPGILKCSIRYFAQYLPTFNFSDKKRNSGIAIQLRFSYLQRGNEIAVSNITSLSESAADAGRLSDTSRRWPGGHRHERFCRHVVSAQPVAKFTAGANPKRG